jgi:hypothetical protein
MIPADISSMLKQTDAAQEILAFLAVCVHFAIWAHLLAFRVHFLWGPHSITPRPTLNGTSALES